MRRLLQDHPRPGRHRRHPWSHRHRRRHQARSPHRRPFRQLRLRLRLYSRCVRMTSQSSDKSAAQEPTLLT